jgi:type IV fimbrial biogenesis protein FimT
MTSKNLPKQSAFSLIELLIIIVIAAILLLIVYPGMHDFYSKNISLAEADKIKTALQLTRNEAIRQNTTMTFCKSKSFNDCDGNWNDGQIIKNPKNTIIRKFDPIPKHDVLTWKSSFSGEKNDYIAFTSTGTTAGQQGSFFYCPQNSPQNNVAIIIQESGNIRISNKTSTGELITCDS